MRGVTCTRRPWDLLSSHERERWLIDSGSLEPLTDLRDSGSDLPIKDTLKIILNSGASGHVINSIDGFKEWKEDNALIYTANRDVV